MIHVAIDARLPDQGQGGVQQVIRTLAEGFQLSKNSEVKRSWILLKGTTWWERVIPAEDSLILVNPPFGEISIWIANRAPKLVSALYPMVSRFKSQKPPLDDLLNQLDVDLVHMPFQDGFRTDFPYIYHPHDLQHEHFPENFRASQLKHRNLVWKEFAKRADSVMAASTLVKDDLIRYWEIVDQKIHVIPIPPPTRAKSQPSRKNQIAGKFIIYPAVFWKHKNHRLIIEAMKIAFDRGHSFHCVFTGSTGSEYRKIRQLVAKHKLRSYVHFLGHLSEEELSATIESASATVVPSLFEANSLTVYDSLKLGTQVLCSDLPFFRNQCGSDVIFFNPYDPEMLATAIIDLLLDDPSSNRHKKFQGNATFIPSISSFIDQINYLYLTYKNSYR